MKIAAVQINVTPGDITKNVKKITRYIDEASSSGNDLVIFPEMSDVGYDMPIIVKTASSWEDEGSPVRILQQKALQNHINIVAGVSERVKEDVYNTLVVINRQGNIVSKYRKTHLITAEPMLEHHHLKAGDKLVTCKIDDVEVGLMTCYDIRFPEVARSLSISGAKLLLVPSAFPLVRLPHWNALNIARAIENQVFLISSNRIGNDAGVPFCGTSMIIDPYGTILSSASAIEEIIVTAELKLSKVEEVRGNIKVHQDRRVDLYKL